MPPELHDGAVMTTARTTDADAQPDERNPDDGRPRAHGPPVRLWVEVTKPVKELRGFRPGHREPKEVTSQTRHYVAGAAAEDLRAEAEALAKRLREGLGLRRRGLTPLGPEVAENRGVISLATPVLTAELTIAQHDVNPGLCVWRREASVPDPRTLAEPGLAFAFAPGFTTLERAFDEPVSVEDLIDALEDRLDAEEAGGPDAGGVTAVDYPLDATSCTVHLAGLDGTVRVTPDAAGVHARTARPPGDLIAAWARVTDLLRAE